MKTILLLASLFLANYTFATPMQMPQQEIKQTQDQVAIHRVALGETVVLIAKKYMVTPKDIYELNPDAIEGLATGMGLRIPVNRKVKMEIEAKNLDYEVVDASVIRKAPAAKKEEGQTIVEKKQLVAEAKAVAAKPVIQPDSPIVSADAEVSHEVKAGETLSGLAQKYNTTIKSLTDANPKLKRGLQAGQTLVIPAKAGAEDAAVASVTDDMAEFTGTHKVKSGETLTGLARKYSTSIEAITSANEKVLKKGLQIGQTLVVPSSSITADEQEVAEVASVPNHASYADPSTGITEHKVESGETLIGLARKYNTTVDAITAANKQKLKKGLQAGQMLVIPASGIIVAHVQH